MVVEMILDSATVIYQRSSLYYLLPIIYYLIFAD
jgi:hypothetical protein